MNHMHCVYAPMEGHPSIPSAYLRHVDAAHRAIEAAACDVQYVQAEQQAGAETQAGAVWEDVLDEKGGQGRGSSTAARRSSMNR